MKRKGVWLSSSLIICFAAGVALAQQVVSPPPKPPDEAPSGIEATAKLLEDKLNSIGRVTWTQTTRNVQSGQVAGPSQAWQELTHAAVNLRTCEMRVTRKSNNVERTDTTYLEENDLVQVFSFEDALNRNPTFQSTITPLTYSVWFSGGTFSGGDFKVRDQETANQIADALRQLALQCKGMIPTVAKDGPSLDETLRFIADKLNQQGAVNYIKTQQNSMDGAASSPEQDSILFGSAVGDSRLCRVNYHAKLFIGAKTVFEGDHFINLRRVEKMTVMPLQDFFTADYARAGLPQLTVMISPPIWSLLGKVPGQAQWRLDFSDEDTANRVANALTHAVELCGGGSKDPF